MNVNFHLYKVHPIHVGKLIDPHGIYSIDIGREPEAITIFFRSKDEMIRFANAINKFLGSGESFYSPGEKDDV